MKKGFFPVLLLGVLLAAVVLFFPRSPGRSEQEGELLTIAARRGSLEVAVDTVGLLDSAKSYMVSSRIRGNKGKIIYLVEDGSWVEKDSVLVRLDPSPFEEEVHRLQGKLDSLDAAVEAARQLVAWEKNQAEQNVAAREYDLKVARLELDRLVKGDGPLQLAQYREKMEKAKAEQERYTSFYRELKELDRQGFKNPAEIARARENAATYKEKYKAAGRRFTSYRDYVLPSMEEAAKAKVENSRLILEQTRKATVFKVANAEADLEQVKAREATVKSSLALARQEFENTVLKAPFAGIAILYEAFRDGQKRKPREGDTVLMYQPILYLPDVTKIIVKTRVREVDLYKIEVGQQATVHIDAYPDLSFPAQVRFIGSLASGENGGGGGKYFQVTLDLQGQDRRLRPGMTARVHIRAENAKNVLLVPVQAVFRDDQGRSFCYVSTPSGLARKPVTTGHRNELQVEVLSGLKAGDLVSLVAPDASGGR